MSLKSIAQLTALALLAIFTTAITIAWRAEQRARAQLQQQLKTAQAQITAATARQSSRNATLNQQLAQLQKKQAATKSPAEILHALPNVLPLPKPLILRAAPCAGAAGAPPVAQASPCDPTNAPRVVFNGESSHNSRSPGTPPSGFESTAATPAPQVILPIEDLKPLYDHAIQCNECLLRLATAQANLKDEQAKTAAVSRELTDALRASKGGSALRRVARAAKWFVVGAAIGAAAAKLSH